MDDDSVLGQPQSVQPQVESKNAVLYYGLLCDGIASHTRWTIISQAVSDSVLKVRDIGDREEVDRCLCLESGRGFCFYAFWSTILFYAQGTTGSRRVFVVDDGEGMAPLVS